MILASYRGSVPSRSFTASGFWRWARSCKTYTPPAKGAARIGTVVFLIFILFCYRFYFFKHGSHGLNGKGGTGNLWVSPARTPTQVFTSGPHRTVSWSPSVDRSPVREAAEIAVVDENVRLQLAGEVVVPVSLLLRVVTVHGVELQATLTAEGQRLLQEHSLTGPSTGSAYAAPIAISSTSRWRKGSSRPIAGYLCSTIVPSKSTAIIISLILNSQFFNSHYKEPDHRTAGVVYVKAGSAYRPKPKGSPSR